MTVHLPTCGTADSVQELFLPEASVREATTSTLDSPVPPPGSDTDRNPHRQFDKPQGPGGPHLRANCMAINIQEFFEVINPSISSLPSFPAELSLRKTCDLGRVVPGAGRKADSIGASLDFRFKHQPPYGIRGNSWFR